MIQRIHDCIDFQYDPGIVYLFREFNQTTLGKRSAVRIRPTDFEVILMRGSINADPDHGEFPRVSPDKLICQQRSVCDNGTIDTAGMDVIDQGLKIRGCQRFAAGEVETFDFGFIENVADDRFPIVERKRCDSEACVAEFAMIIAAIGEVKIDDQTVGNKVCFRHEKLSLPVLLKVHRREKANLMPTVYLPCISSKNPRRNDHSQ